MRIDIPYLVADTDRHGNVRIYSRRKGKPKVRVDLWVVPRGGDAKTARPIKLSADKRRRKYARFVRVYVGTEEKLGEP